MIIGNNLKNNSQTSFGTRFDSTLEKLILKHEKRISPETYSNVKKLLLDGQDHLELAADTAYCSDLNHGVNSLNVYLKQKQQKELLFLEGFNEHEYMLSDAEELNLVEQLRELTPEKIQKVAKEKFDNVVDSLKELFDKYNR